MDSVAPQPPQPPVRPITPAPRRSAAPVIALLAFLVLAALGGAAYLAYEGYIDVPGITKRPPTLEQLGASFGGVTSAHVMTSFSLAIEPRDPEVQQIPLPSDEETGDDETEPDASQDEDGDSSAGSGLSSAGAVAAAFLTDASLTMDVEADWQNAAGADQQSLFKGMFRSGGLALSIDAEVRKKAGVSFMKINALPLPIGDTSAIIGKWIRFPESASGFAATSSSSEVFGKRDSSKEEALAAAHLKAVYDAALANGAFAMTSSESTSRNGERVWLLTFGVDAAKLLEAYDTAHAAASAKGETSAVVDAKIADELRNDDTREDLEKLARHAVITLTVARKTSEIRMVELDWRLGLPDSFIEGKQLHIKSATSYTNVNQPFVVAEPESPLAYDEAFARVTGTESSAAADLSQRQRANIGDVRDALLAYEKANGVFPASLDALVGFEVDGRKVERIPADLYTNAPFPYQLSTTEGFELEYQIQSSGEGGFTVIIGAVVEGKNTATKNVESREHGARDADGDGLTDYEEGIHGTAAFFSDTDEDGFSDKQEIDGGYDPLLNAKTNVRYDEFGPLDGSQIILPSSRE